MKIKLRRVSIRLKMNLTKFMKLFLNTLQTPTRQSPKLSHVGSLLLIEARCGLFLPSCSVGKQSQLLLQPTKVELGLQVGVEFDKNSVRWRLQGPRMS